MKTTVRAILLNRENQCLFVQHNEWNPLDRGKWATVGGQIEHGENHKICLRRELCEEFGSSIADRIKIGPQIFQSSRSERTDYFYVVWFDGDEISIESKDEILDHRWCTVAEAKDLKFYFGFEIDLYLAALGISR